MDPSAKYNRKTTNFHYKNKKKNYKNVNEIKPNYNNSKMELNKNKFQSGEAQIQVEKKFSGNMSLVQPFNKSSSDRIINQNHISSISVANPIIENGDVLNVYEENIENSHLRKGLPFNTNSKLINNASTEIILKNDQILEKNGTDSNNQLLNIVQINMLNSNLNRNTLTPVLGEKLVDINLKISNNEGDIVNDNYESKRHPLCCSWTFWHAITGNDFTNSLTDIKTFDTVEDFWSLVNHMIPPTQLIKGSDFSLFKSGIKPMWEDKMNANGCSIVITIKNDYDIEITNFLWLDTLLSLIDGQTYGSNFEQICGAVVSIRLKLQRISLWISNRNEKKVIEEIEKKFISYLKDGGHFSKRIVVNFKAHGH